MNCTIFIFLASFVSCAWTLQFGERKIGNKEFEYNNSYAILLDKFLVSPSETQTTNHKVTCYDKIQQFVDNSTQSWLHFYLIVALHVTQLFNLGLYQDINVGKICVHGSYELVRVSFPDSPMLVHDQGTLTIPHALDLPSNHRILHPFDDFVKFARFDLPPSLFSWRLAVERNIVAAIFHPFSVKFFTSFSAKARQRLLIPLHPIYMVRDIYRALLETKGFVTNELLASQVENQIRLANLSLSSPIPWPLPASSNPQSANKILTMPDSVFSVVPYVLFPLEFSLNLLPRENMKLQPAIDNSACANPEQEMHSESSILDDCVSREKIHSGRKTPSSQVTARMAPLFRIGHSSVHQGYKSYVVDNSKIIHDLHKDNKAQSFLLGKKMTYRRILSKKVLDVTHVKDYFLQHPFFSDFVHNKGPHGRSFFLIRHFIKSRCREYRDIKAPLLDLVCKKRIPLDYSLPFITSQSHETQLFFFSWFSTFLSGITHPLDRHPSAPSILKALLHQLADASIAKKTRYEGPRKTFNYLSILNNRRSSTYIDIPPVYILPKSKVSLNEIDTWIHFDNIKGQLNSKEHSLSAQESDKKVGEYLNNLTTANNKSHNSKEPMNGFINLTDSPKNSEKNVSLSGSLILLKYFVGCGELLTALLHYFIFTTTPSPHALPIPKVLSIVQTSKLFDYQSKENKALPRNPVLAEIALLYNSKLFASIGLSYPLLPPESTSILSFILNQYQPRQSHKLLKAFQGPPSTSFLRTASSLFQHYSSFTTKLRFIIPSVPYNSWHTLSLFHSLTSMLSSFDELAYISDSPYFAYFLGSIIYHFSLPNSPEVNVLAELCDSRNSINKSKLANALKKVHGYDIHLEIQSLCSDESSNFIIMAEHFISSCDHLAIQVYELSKSINRISDEVFVIHVVVRWAFAVQEDIKAGNEKELKKHSLLFFATPQGIPYIHEFFHDAAVVHSLNVTPRILTSAER